MHSHGVAASPHAQPPPGGTRLRTETPLLQQDGPSPSSADGSCLGNWTPKLPVNWDHTTGTAGPGALPCTLSSRQGTEKGRAPGLTRAAEGFAPDKERRISCRGKPASPQDCHGFGAVFRVIEVHLILCFTCFYQRCFF